MGYFVFFCDLSGAYVGCIYRGLGVKINIHKKPQNMQDWSTHKHKDPGRILLAFVGKDQTTPNWSSMADEAIIQGGIGGLGFPFYICGTYIAIYTEHPMETPKTTNSTSQCTGSDHSVVRKFCSPEIGFCSLT